MSTFSSDSFTPHTEDTAILVDAAYENRPQTKVFSEEQDDPGEHPHIRSALFNTVADIAAKNLTDASNYLKTILESHKPTPLQRTLGEKQNPAIRKRCLAAGRQVVEEALHEEPLNFIRCLDALYMLAMLRQESRPRLQEPQTEAANLLFAAKQIDKQSEDRLAAAYLSFDLMETPQLSRAIQEGRRIQKTVLDHYVRTTGDAHSPEKHTAGLLAMTCIWLQAQDDPEIPQNTLGKIEHILEIFISTARPFTQERGLRDFIGFLPSVLAVTERQNNGKSIQAPMRTLLQRLRKLHTERQDAIQDLRKQCHDQVASHEYEYAGVPDEEDRLFALSLKALQLTAKDHPEPCTYRLITDLWQEYSHSPQHLKQILLAGYDALAYLQKEPYLSSLPRRTAEALVTCAQTSPQHFTLLMNTVLETGPALAQKSPLGFATLTQALSAACSISDSDRTALKTLCQTVAPQIMHASAPAGHLALETAMQLAPNEDQLALVLLGLDMIAINPSEYSPALGHVERARDMALQSPAHAPDIITATCDLLWKSATSHPDMNAYLLAGCSRIFMTMIEAYSKTPPAPMACDRFFISSKEPHSPFRTLVLFPPAGSTHTEPLAIHGFSYSRYSRGPCNGASPLSQLSQVIERHYRGATFATFESTHSARCHFGAVAGGASNAFLTRDKLPSLHQFVKKTPAPAAP